LRATVTTSLALALALAFAASRADAHKMSVRRALFLETAGARELHIVVAIRIPSGEARRAFDVIADSNHDGRYSEEERAQVRSILASRMLDGLLIRTATSALELAGIEIKEKIEPGEGPVEVMLHATAVLFGPELSVTTTNVGDPLDLVVLRGSRPVVETSRGKVENGSVKTEMGLGDRVRLRVTS
jgi:hypothetical protein